MNGAVELRGGRTQVHGSGARATAITVAIALALVVGCELEPDLAPYNARALSIFVSGTSVYTGGYSLDGDGVPTACYWKDSSRTDMPQYGSAAYALFVEGGTVYMAGECYDGGEWRACFWKGTERTVLSTSWGPTRGYATSVAVSAGVVYTAGNCSYSYTSVPHYWTDSAWTELATAGVPNGAYAQSIFVVGDTVYVAGKYYNGVGWIPCYWENATRTDLPGGSGATYSIFFDSGTIYTAGEYFNGTFWKPCYWEGTTLINLTDPYAEAYAASIFVESGTVHAAGAYRNIHTGTWHPVYWKREGQCFYTNLPCQNSTQAGYATSVFVAGGTVYASGYYHNGSVYVPCFWRDTARTDLAVPEGEAKGQARACGIRSPALHWSDGPVH